ncbi:MAG: glycosyltransferase family 4 protein [Thalassotalea sp.]|nr:glycosyltransferase family 4 protein [Thalassotalea sp.]
MHKVALIINDVSNIGGTEKVTIHLANLLADNGCDVSIISLHQSSERTFFPVNEKVRLSSLRSSPVSLMKQAISLSFSLAKQTSAFDFVILSDTQLSILSFWLRLRGKSKIVSWEHFNSKIVTRFGSRWFGRRFAAWFSDLIVVLTEEDKRNWLDCFWVRRRIECIANPSSVSLRSKPIAENRSNTLLSVGRFTEQKGFDYLVEAWHLIPELKRQGWKIKIVGPNGSAKQALKKRIEQLGLNDAIELAGASSDMQAEYDQADIYVMSSRYEGFGLTLIEAMSSGLPVIAFDCPMGPGEIIVEKFGISVPATNIKALSEAITSLVSSDENRKYYSEQALRRAADFNEQAIVAIWLNQLAQIRNS